MVQRPEKIASYEGEPPIKTIDVDAKFIREAMGKVKNGAGKKEFVWVLNPKNFEKAKAKLKVNCWNFFPNATSGEYVSAVYCGTSECSKLSYHLDLAWDSIDYGVVVLD
jgi:hypothetical protein